MSACLTDCMLIVGGDTKSWVVETIFIGKLGIFIINVRIIDLDNTKFSDFLRVQKAELDFRNLIPLPLSVNGIGHDRDLKD